MFPLCLILAQIKLEGGLWSFNKISWWPCLCQRLTTRYVIATPSVDHRGAGAILQKNSSIGLQVKEPGRKIPEGQSRNTIVTGFSYYVVDYFEARLKGN
jgi:hypothetical protein